MGGKASKAKQERIEREKAWHRERDRVLAASSTSSLSSSSSQTSIAGGNGSIEGLSSALPATNNSDKARKEATGLVKKNKNLFGKEVVSRLPNDFFQRYRIGDLVGEGGFSKVVALNNDGSGLAFAGKVILCENVPRQEHSMIDTEAAILERCKHPNIVHFVEMVVTSKEWVIVMELIIGTELQIYVDSYVEEHKRSISEKRAKSIVSQVALAVEYLHCLNIVYSDLKPENVMIQVTREMKENKLWGDQRRFAIEDQEDFVKLVDFGCAATVGGRDDKVKVFRGTREYASPEMLGVAEYVLKSKGKGKAGAPDPSAGYCQSTDIWGIGVVMFFVLGGYPPFIGDSEEDTPKMIKLGDPGYVDKYWKDVSSEAKDLLSVLLNVREEERPSIQDVLAHEWFGDMPIRMRKQHQAMQ